jgi:hypothetical protein
MQQQHQSYSSQPQPAYVPPMEGTAPAVGVATGRGPAQDWKVGFFDCFSPGSTCKSSPEGHASLPWPSSRLHSIAY